MHTLKEKNRTLMLIMFDNNEKEHQLIIEYPYTNVYKILLDIFNEVNIKYDYQNMNCGNFITIKEPLTQTQIEELIGTQTLLKMGDQRCPCLNDVLSNILKRKIIKIFNIDGG
ncbi:Uncharacterised protein [Actinobacillus porcinus]|uniref:Uncharacterized protein n=2 Tax=Actinobacillus porcinus TaxID=51048 RepID=A0ABY6TI67_9PAST|nr:hypothetical protein [Actinobacillus porcinus]VFY92619.1 Uncharacterised protein [Actinobacillus porcinus]VTU06880.1 Uncharacterised protein [Actinobacillus porcinus]